MANERKRVVYLWGAGATQGEAQYLGAPLSLLMGDTEQFGPGISRRILKRVGPKAQALFGGIESPDIEKLISLLGQTGIVEHSVLADQMRTQYFNELRDSLAEAKVIESPQLAINLLELHTDRLFASEVETLSGIITTNHDGLLQIAFQAVYCQLNLGVSYVSEYFAPPSSKYTPPLIQLHGSFTWGFGVPMRVAPLHANSSYAKDTVWIPPTTAKDSRSYPFNKLSALAYELLSEKCDVLRIVGASLTQNDWNVLSLIFNAQRHREVIEGSPFSIELIMPQAIGAKIERECAYLRRLTPIGNLHEGDFAAYKDDKAIASSDMENPFGYWLNQKIEFHANHGELDGVQAAAELAA